MTSEQTFEFVDQLPNAGHGMVNLPCYVYVWGNNSKRKTLKGRACKIVKRGAKRSALIEFLDNGQRELVDRYALRKHNVKGDCL